MKAFAALRRAGEARCPVRTRYSRWVTANSLKTRRSERASRVCLGVCNVGFCKAFRARGPLVCWSRFRAASATRARTRSVSGLSELEVEESENSRGVLGMGSCQGGEGPASA